ncbi:MAG TPA: glycogen synthase GlgA [Burkholderiales bacterium]|nr:glycogen synthase GlgA [Burkholderiales bacterium]
MNGATPRILFVTPECAPWVKTGGLGDVSAALPAALQALGCDVAILMPAYRGMHAIAQRAQEAATIPALAELPAARILEAHLDNGVTMLLLDAPALYDREAGPYLDATGRDWPDNHLRFGALSHAAAVVARNGLAGGWRPDLVHCNDWPAALAPAYLRFEPPTEPVPTLLTIHNLAFQGLFPAQTLAQLGLPKHSYDIDGLEFWGQVSFLKGGICYADAITAVSPNYAREIQGKELGFGLDELLHARRDVLHGIVNGIDTDYWNPATDPMIAAQYDVGWFDAKPFNKLALQKRLSLPQDSRIPVLGTVGRITLQKGFDLIAAIAEELMEIPVHLVMLGSGSLEIEEQLLRLQSAYPKCIGLKIGFDEKLAHMIEAGADMFLMPSRFEPCGLNQMYSQRYGTPPVANATGGLVDTIIDYDGTPESAERATGFLFHEASPEALLEAIRRALDCYREPELWRKLCFNGMKTDFSWQASAKRYVDLYRSQIKKT